MSKTRAIYHIVFATKHRQRTITELHKRELYAYIFGIIKRRRCYVLRINGMPDHIHILLDLSPTIALADLVRDIKQYSSRWLKENGNFPDFVAWNDGYYAVTLEPDSIESCKKYIIEQETHHKGTDLLTEVQSMALRYGMTWFAADWE